MLGTLIAAIFSGEAAGMVGRARRAVVAYVVAGLCALVGVGFLIGALFTWLAEKYGSVETALGFGAGFILIAGIVMLVNAVVSRRVRKITANRRRSEIATIAATAAVSVLPGLLRGKVTPLSMVVAPVMAFVAYSLLRQREPADSDDDDADGS